MQKSQRIIKRDLECRRRNWCSIEKNKSVFNKVLAEWKTGTSRNIIINKYLYPGKKGIFQYILKRKRTTEFFSVKQTLKRYRLLRKDSRGSQLKRGDVMQKNVPYRLVGQTRISSQQTQELKLIVLLEFTWLEMVDIKMGLTRDMYVCKIDVKCNITS